jgi:hypothetical protein
MYSYKIKSFRDIWNCRIEALTISSDVFIKGVTILYDYANFIIHV